MNPTPEPSPATEDPRLLRAVQEYLEELEAGRRPDRRAQQDVVERPGFPPADHGVAPLARLYSLK